MPAIQMIVAAVTIVLILAVLLLVRRAHIRVEYSVSWLGAGVALLVLALYPGLLPTLARGAGLEDEALTLLLLVGCVFLFVLFRLSMVVSSLKDNNIALAQRVAILEYHITHGKQEEAKR
jgi:hypothetical protein